jgi:hypothetical protein
MSTIIERLMVLLVIGIAAIAITGGVAMATVTKDSHWVNRSGALVVASESLLLLAELTRRTRIRRIEEEHGGKNPYVSIEASRAERRLIVIAVATIVVGEIVHGFGDLLWDAACADGCGWRVE